MPADPRTVARRRAPRRGPPSPLLLFLPSFLLTLGAVVTAAVHASLGAPLGPAFAAEVWSLAKTFVAASLALGGFGGYVAVNNRRAWRALEEEDARPAPRPVTAGRNARPLVTDTVRARRTGRLTPVDDPDGERADVAGDGRPPPRHAGGGGGGPR